MARLLFERSGGQWGSIPLAIGLFISVSALVALCAKKTRSRAVHKSEEKRIGSKFAPTSPLVKPGKQLVTNISNKAIQLIHKKGADTVDQSHEVGIADKEEGEGVWRKGILMGERCQPPEFSGAIFYDNYGNLLSEPPPRSPRASPLPNFMLPVARDAN
ncbi:hypothetical protein SLE2022_219310 [Rubroshorea leprosula]